MVLHISQQSRIRVHSLALGDFGESGEIFCGIWIEWDFSSQMGVLLGHVINMDYKCLIGKIVLNLQPTTLLLLEVALWKAFFSALCGRFGGCNKHCACLGQGWTNGGSWTSRTFSTQQGSWEVMGFGGLRKQGLCPVLQHLLQQEWATVAVAVKTHLQAHRVGAGLPRSAVPQLQEWERARLVLRAFLASPKS